jgi:hypothetical protein
METSRPRSRRVAAAGFLSLAACAVVLGWSASASAALKVWNGGTTTWSTGTWVGGAPGASDIALFDGTSQNNCNVSANTTVAGIIVESSYTGTLTVASGVTVTVTNMGITDGLVGYWPLDETSGTTAYDRSGFGTDLTYLAGNLPAPSASKPTTTFYNARSLTFTNGDALVKTTYPAQFEAADWTIAAWITKSSTFGTSDCGSPVGSGVKGSEILNLGNDLGLRVCGNGVVRVFKDTSGGYTTCVSSNSLSTGSTWHHVAATNSGTTLTVYLNGTKTVCTGTGTPVYTNGTTLRIGKHDTSDGYNFDGNIDELRYYDRALSEYEIAALRAGDHPPAVTRAQNVGGLGTFDVSSNLVLNGQRAALGIFNVAGSFFNFNSTTTGTTAITLDGSGTGEVGGYGGFVHALTLAGSATRTVTDQLVVKGTLAISSATVISNQTVYAGTLNHTAGTLTTTGSTVIADHGAAQTFRATTSALNTLRVGDGSRTNLLGYWKLDEGSLTTANDSSGNGRTGTLAGGPTWTGSAATDITFANTNSLTFDGADDRVSFAWGTYYQAVTLSAWIYMTGDGDSSYPRVIQLPYINLVVRVNDADRISTDVIFDGTEDAVWKSEKSIVRNTWQHVALTYNGNNTTTLPDLYINGIRQNILIHNAPNGSRVQTTGTSFIGNKDAAGSSSFQGRIDDVRIYNAVLTDAQILALASGKGEAATFTLGANLSAAAVTIDKGTLATSTYTMGHSTMTVESGGSFNIGGNTVTASDNVTVNAGGTLNMDSVNGGSAPTLSMASGKTLLVNGTLATSIGTTAPKSIIRATSNTFIFNVSTVAAGTAVLDIDGLAVQNTTSQGMYINSNSTASTTFTSFKNIDFSHSVSAGGPYAYLLQIDADSLNQNFDDLTFDTTNTTYNFRLKDRNGGTNTRAFVGGSCTGDLDCEANDHDGDVGVVAPINDNNIDTVAANPDEDPANSALIFWGERAHTDTAGTIVGFPVAAYDWNDFSFRANYVSFNNAHSNGTGDILYVRDEDGSPQYLWNLPPNAGNSNNFVGAPRWTEEGGVHYVYVLDSDGNVYKLLDNGSSLALAGSPWNTAYRYTTDGTAADATSPLTISGTYMYWYGHSGAGASAPRMFRLNKDKTGTTPHSLGAGDLLYTAPAVATVGGEEFVFGATTKNGANATVYKIAWDFSPVSSITVPTATVNSRVTLISGLVYFIDETGKVWVRSASNLSTSSWFYRDGTANHAPACADSGGAAGCVAKNLLVEPLTGYVYYGDADGHVYCARSTSGGSACPSYPFRPGTSSDVFETAPLLRQGVLVIGATNGNVYFIDRSAGTVFRRYELGAPVSSISYTFDRTDANSGAFMIATGTAPGKLYQIRRTYVLDPSAPL